MKLTIQVPGKLMLSGEWAILEPGNKCIVLAVDRYVYCDYEDSESFLVNLPDIGLNSLQASYADNVFSWQVELDETQKKQAELARRALELTCNFLKAKGKEIKPFSVSTDSVEHTITLTDGTQQKVGLGTSAGVAVALVGTLLKIHGYDIIKQASMLLIYKLATLAHYQAQGNLGSGFDIAACTFGKAVLYQRFDEKWLLEQLKEELSPDVLEALAEKDWPDLQIDRLKLPDQMQIAAAWVGNPASTTELVQKMKAFKQKDPDNYNQLITMIAQTTDKLLEAINEDHQEYMLNLIEANRLVLQKLGEVSSIAIETPELAKLAEIAQQNKAAAKLSGAGGGDCGLAVCFDQFVKEDIEWAWEEAGFYPLDVFISDKGVSVWY